MLEGRFWELTLNLDTETYWTSSLEEASAVDPDTRKKRSLVGNVRFKDVQKSPGENISAGRVTLLFHPKGLAEPAVIHLASPEDRVQTVIINAFSGRTIIQEGYVEG
jgi:hypothetical protein